MVWLLVSILSSSALLLIFKAFGQFKVQLFPAIVVNYIVCFICGNIHLGSHNLFSEPVWNAQWFPKVAVMGFFFISAFYLIGLGTRIAGAGAASVASKMSVVIPAMFAIFFWNESFSWIQYVGILISLISVYLVTPDTPEEHKKHKGLWVLALVFIASGSVDTGLNLVHHNYGHIISDEKISTIIFGTAALVGSFIVPVRYSRMRPGKKEILGGAILGVINYLSLLAMFGALSAFHGKTTLYFAINNIGVVIASTLLAVWLFKEKIYSKEKIGLLLAVIAILFMNFNVIF